MLLVEGSSARSRADGSGRWRTVRATSLAPGVTPTALVRAPSIRSETSLRSISHQGHGPGRRLKQNSTIVIVPSSAIESMQARRSRRALTMGLGKNGANQPAKVVASNRETVENGVTAPISSAV